MLFGIRGIEESSVYQAIFRKGETQGLAVAARTILLRQGLKKLGPPGERIEAEIAAMRDVDHLYDLIDRVDNVSTWDELMASPDRYEVAPMPFGISGIAKPPADQDIRRKARSIGLAEAFAEGYVGVYAEAYAEVFAEGYVGVYAESYAGGRIQSARALLLRHGTKKLGPPDERIEVEIAAIGDVDRLHDLIDRVLDASTWADLLAPSDSDA
jgi:hypothetical protein